MVGFNFGSLFIALLTGYALFSLLRGCQSMKRVNTPSFSATLLLGNPEIKTWQQHNVTGRKMTDLKAIHSQFGLDLKIVVVYGHFISNTICTNDIFR